MKVEQKAGEDNLLLDIEFQRLAVEIDEGYGPQIPESSIPMIPSSPFISAAVLATKAKQFDDGLYAAVELMVQNGTAKLPSKQALLSIISTNLLNLKEPLLKGSLNVLAASRFGGVELNMSDEVAQAVSQVESEFLSDDLKSKPISFYTWSEELGKIFQQDRILQEKLEVDQFNQVLPVLKQEELTNSYLSYLAFVSRLTNPLVNSGLSSFLSSSEGHQLPPEDELSMLPPSKSPEGELVKKLFGNRPIPDGFELMQEVIDRIRSGEINFTPTEQSGWYDYQLWSYEPLLIPDRMPEKVKLTVEESYREKLEELFKGLFALARETHAKQLEVPICGTGAPLPRKEIFIRPECTIELLPTHYLRRARTYAFLKAILVEHLGEECLKRESRLTKDGCVQLSIFDELSQMIQFFYGAHCQACDELGMPFEDIERLEPVKCKGLLRNWYSEALNNDADLSQDMRMMVPVFYDAKRKLTKVWLFMGWTRNRLKVSYKNTPVLLAVNGNKPDRKEYDITFASSVKLAAYPAFAEVYVSRLLNRDEFRAHCDMHRTIEKIISNLPGAQVTSAVE